MAKKLDNKILDQIELIMPPAKKELRFIQSRDWAEVENLKKRESMYKLQDILNSRNLTALLKFHTTAKEDLGHPKVKKTIELLLQFYFILEERYNKMSEKFDWTTYVDDAGAEKGNGMTAEKKQELEIEFQSGVLKDYSKFKEDLRKINFGEDVVTVDIPIHGDTPIPIVMRETIENRYPEVAEHIKIKEQEANG